MPLPASPSVQEVYCATPESIAELEQEFANEAVVRLGGAVLGAVILDSPDVHGRYGTIARSLEVQKGFDEMLGTSPAFEASSKFLFIVDGEANKYITHLTRLIQPGGVQPLAAVQEILDDLEGQVDLTEVVSHHNIQGLEQCLFISTDLAAPDVLPTRTKPYGLLAYRAIFEYAEGQGITHVLGYMNQQTLRGLGRLGIVPEALCGRTDYVIPPQGDITFEQYQPYVIKTSGHTHRVYTDAAYAAEYSRWGAQVAAIDMPLAHMSDVGGDKPDSDFDKSARLY